MTIQPFNTVSVIPKEVEQTCQPLNTVGISSENQLSLARQVLSFQPATPAPLGSSVLSFSSFTSSQVVDPARLVFRLGLARQILPSQPPSSSLSTTSPLSSSSSSLYVEEECVREAFRAVSKYNIDRLRQILDAGLNPNSQNSSGDFLIHEAARNGCLESVKLLIERGCNIDQVSRCGRRPIFDAFNDKFTKAHIKKVVKFMLDKGASVCNGLLFTLIDYKFASLIKIVLKKGVDVNCRNSDGWTPLTAAVWDRTINCDVIEVLLKNGADVNQTRFVELSKLGKNKLITPLMKTYLDAQSIKLFELLLKYGASRSEFHYMRYEHEWTLHKSPGFRQVVYAIIDEELAKGKRSSDSAEERSSKEARSSVEQTAARAEAPSFSNSFSQSESVTPALLSSANRLVSSNPIPDSGNDSETEDDDMEWMGD